MKSLFPAVIAIAFICFQIFQKTDSGFPIPSVVSTARAGEDCPKKGKLDEIKDRYSSYVPPKPPQGGATGNQERDMNQSSRNAGAAREAATACANAYKGFSKEFKDAQGELSDPKCKTEKDEAKQLEQEAKGKAGQCSSAAGAAGGQEDKNKDNSKKMGDDKDKGKGGDGGKMPEIPPPPPKKEEKKEDLVAKERERLAKIANCKARVNNALEIKKKNCEYQFPYDLAHPVAIMKQRQDECKQQAIFANMAELNGCETNPDGSVYTPPYIPPPTPTATATGTNTQKTTSTQTGSTISTQTH